MGRALGRLTLLGLVIVFSGCLGQDLPSTNRIRGRVVFHDTDLAIRAAVTVGEESVVTGTGMFTIAVDPGPQRYSVSTLLGEYHGILDHEPGKSLKFQVPPFDGWSRRHFNDILLWDGRTVRWPYGKTVNVWIQPIDTDARLAPEHYDRAWDVLREWEDILSGAIRFQQTTERGEADLEWLWVESSAIRGNWGMCTLSHSHTDWHISRAKIEIAFEALHSRGTYSHEVGHCIGLNHSSDPSHVMHAPSGSDRPTSIEQNLARLTYSLAPGTGSLPVVAPGAHLDRFAAVRADYRVDPTTGEVTVSIP